MAMTGIQVDDECKKTFETMHMKKACRYVIFKIEKKTIVKVAKVGERNASYEDFLKEEITGNNESLYAVFDYEYEEEGVTRGKIAFISWIPDTGKPMEKMIYAGTKEGLIQALGGSFVHIQGSDAATVSAEAVLAKIKQHK